MTKLAFYSVLMVLLISCSRINSLAPFDQAQARIIIDTQYQSQATTPS